MQCRAVPVCVVLSSVSSVSLPSLGSDLSAIYPQRAYCKFWLSSLGSSAFVPIGTMPILFVLLPVGFAVSLNAILEGSSPVSLEALLLAVLPSILSSHEL